MAGQSVSSLWFIFISCLIGGVISLPLQELDSNNPSPAWSDWSPRSAYPEVGARAMMGSSGSKPQMYNGEEPSMWIQQNSDPKADGGVYYSNYGSNMDAADAGWATKGGMDSGSDGYYPGPEGYADEEGPVLSDVSDLDPVYHFSSRSRYQQGRQAFHLTRYTPGEPTASYGGMSDHNSYAMGKGEGMPVVPGQPGKVYY